MSIFKILQSWYKNVVGKISIICLILSLILLIMAFSESGNFSAFLANNINSTLIGLATNLIGIIITIGFIQYFLELQNENNLKENERILINQYNRKTKILIEKYKMYFHSITTPLSSENRFGDSLNIRVDFPFEDLCDMYKSSPFVNVNLIAPSIELFYEAEKELRDYMIKMMENITFKYNKEIFKILAEFTENSIRYDRRNAILNNKNISSGNRKTVADMAEQIMKDHSKNLVEDFHSGKLGSNLIIPYIEFYDLLKIEIDLIFKYEELIDKIKD